jgi:hypothetical protein
MVMKRTLLPLLALLALGRPATAADYLFKVNDLKAELSVRRDGKVDIRYAITFEPVPGSSPIDIVDIGMPNESYDLGSARAAVQGTKLDDIRRSAYVKPGIEVHLGDSAIAPGQSATLEFAVTVDRLVYPDSKDKLYASLQFKTTWYDRKYVTGNARRIEIQFDMPPGSGPEDVRYHGFGSEDYKPSEMFLEGDHAVYRWVWLDVPATVPYSAGASFPRRLVAGVYSPPRASVLISFLSAVFAFVAFVLSLLPVWIIVLIVVVAARSSRRRRQQYLPPRVGIESGGIKRGLTPPEAALLQELPLPKVLLLVVFGLLKKEKIAVREVSAKDFRFRALDKDGQELHEYEAAFLAAIDKDERLEKGLLRKMFTDMIAALQKKMAGFSRRETNQYYRSIMDKAWEQVKNAPREKLPEELARSLEWLALDPEYEKKLDPYADQAVVIPGGGGYWYRNLPQRTSAGGASVPGKGLGQGVGARASALVQSLQVFSGALLGDSAAFTSAITQVTNPPPVRTYSSSGGHGGGCACACACACAGCACACAGGGR